MKIIILGAGITGVTSAYFLAKAGYEVVVLEKNAASGLGCSFANGGQLSFSHSEPWSSRASLISILKAAFQSDSFFSFTNKTDPQFYRWAMEFIKNSCPKKNQDITAKLLKIGNFSRLNLEKILREEKIDFHYKDQGILHFYRSQKKFNQALKQAKLEQSLGAQLEILSANECIKKEPTLIKLFDEKRLAGGIFYKNDASGDASAFIKALEEICKTKFGVVFEYNARIKNIFTNYEKVTGIHTQKGVFTGDHYVFALGSYGMDLLNGIKIDPKIYPIKGYSLSIPSNQDFLSPNLSLTDPENKIVYSKLGNVFRAAGTLEIAGFNSEPNSKNIEFLKQTIRTTYSDFGDLSHATSWSGFRPYRPNCLPLACRVKKYPNLFINSGHGSLGWTNSFATSKLIADMIIKDSKNSEFSFFEEMEKNIYLD
jgi:D-amino-acid dehydrogenase